MGKHRGPFTRQKRSPIYTKKDVYVTPRKSNPIKWSWKVKRKQYLTQERWEALKALDIFFGYTPPT